METSTRTAPAAPGIGRTTFRPGPARGVAELPPVMADWSTDMMEDASAVEALRVEMAVLRERLAQAAPRRAVAEMDKAIGLLNRRVEAMGAQLESRPGAAEGGAPQHHPVESDAGPRALAAELAAVKAALEAMRVPERFAALSAGLDALARRLDAADPRATPPKDVAHLAAQVGELKDLVSRALAGQALQRLAERIATCADQVARAGDAAARKMDDATVAFQRSADALFARIQQLQVAAGAADAAGTAHLQRKFTADFDALNRRLDALGRQMADLTPAAQRAVAAELGALVERLEAAGRAGVGAESTLSAAVEERLAALGERLRETGARLDRLDGIETKLGRLAAEMRLVREAAETSAAASAAEAAQRVVMKVSEDPAGPAVVGLKRGLALLEARQDEIERRTREALAGDVELELEELTGSLGRAAADDGVWIPRGREARAGAGVPSADEVEAAFADVVAVEEARRTDPRAARPETETPWPRTPDASERAERSAAGGREEARAADAGLWRSRARRGAQAAARARATRHPVQRREARRQAALMALLAGAVVILVGTVGLIAWRAWPEPATDGLIAQAGMSLPPGAPVPDAGALPEPVGPAALRRDARAGDANAAYEVGIRFAEGRGGPADSGAAAQWLARAVALGSAPAAYRLAALKEHLDDDFAAAARLYLYAAERGHVRAMHALAVLCSRGIEGTPDWAAASRWTQAAAERGERDSQHNLGVILARGLAGRQDFAAAWKWFALAAAQGDADSAAKRDSLVERVDPARLIAVQQEVAAFTPKAFDAAANTVATRPEWQDPEPDAPQAFKAASVMPSGR